MKEEWYSDSILSPDFQLENKTCRNILLTGGTGFVGTHILHELLEQTEDNLFVLVRGNSEEGCFERLKQKLEDVQLWNDQYASRINVLKGNMESDCLGLSRIEWKLLSASIDIIIHDGAYVNLMGTYKKHYVPNVKSALELLNLAACGKKKKFVYVSTSGIFGGLYKPTEFEEGFTIKEDADITVVRSIFSYVKTKWVADRLVQQAARRGMDTSIFRLPHVGCDTLTGYFNKGDIFWSRLKAFSKIGQAPVLNHLFYIAPVDYVAKTLVYISRKDFTGLNFYTTVSSDKVTWMSIAQALNNCGHKIEIVDSDVWYKNVSQYIEETNDIDVRLMFAYADNNFSSFRCPYMANDNFMAALPEEMKKCQDINKIVAAYFRYGNAHNL